ncbi:MAG: exodeoxyribonuclease III [Gammaproteobacteria bacterium]|nr:exodeoxyribonuclease III [Gammaproteobacteria bacterium]
MFKIATWNVNSLRVRLPQVLEWLEAERPDVLAMQETKLIDADFPHAPFSDLGYSAAVSGQKTYNGVALISRAPACDIVRAIPSYPDEQRRILKAGIAGIPVLNLYVPNGSEVGSDKYAYKLEWLNHLQQYVRDLLRTDAKLIILGDLNIAPEEADVHDPELWKGQVLFSELERAEFRKLIANGLKDCFRLFPQPEESFTWWDYRAAGFRRNLGLRIDHILAGPELAPRCRACRIDRLPRAWERPSDHAPVIAEFDI